MVKVKLTVRLEKDVLDSLIVMAKSNGFTQAEIVAEGIGLFKLMLPYKQVPSSNKKGTSNEVAVQVSGEFCE